MTKVGVGFRKVYAHVDIEAFAKKIEEIWGAPYGIALGLAREMVAGELTAIEINYNPNDFYILKEEFKEIGVEVEQLDPPHLVI